MRIAFVSDIHGNLPALEAVVADMARRGVDRVVNLGDSLSGPLLPEETAQCLMAQDWLHLAGNHERQLLDRPVERMNASDAHARARLSPRTLHWVATLAHTHRLDADVWLCHGSPRSDLEYLLETVTPEGLRLARAEEIAERRGHTPARLIACGHSHLPRALRAADGCLLLNPGSVGLPGYDDDHPHIHWVDNGSPDARYAIAERAAHGHWRAELLAVPYDHAAMAALARRHQREDWAVPLATGYALRATGDK
jgi:predicted phosphodiesterase